MDLLHNLALGFSVLADPMTIVYSLIGVVCGVIIGALPGLGPSVGIAVLLPMCYGLDPACALCMLCGIYYGAMYGGSITSILINTPELCSKIGYHRCQRHEQHHRYRPADDRCQTGHAQGLPCFSLPRHGISVQGRRSCRGR